MLALSFVVIRFPQIADIPHSYDLCEQLKPETRGKIFCAKWQDAPVVGAKPAESESQTELQALFDAGKIENVAHARRAALDQSAKLEELYMVLRNADKVGDIVAAQAAADAIRERSKFDPSTAKPIDFSDLIPSWNKAPNGYSISFTKEISLEEKKSIANEYSDVLGAKANHARVTLILRVFAFWLCSSLIVYCFGWSVGWVYHGFKKLE